MITVADLEGTLRRFNAAGVSAGPMSGRVRLMTHADLTDADITTALDRIGSASHGNDGFKMGAGPAPAQPGGR